MEFSMGYNFDVKPSGLRERKKQKTKLAIQREAMRLFEAQGYDETTIDQIAEAAEVSPSTFFNYFPTKEDVVFRDDYEQILFDIFVERPGGETLLVAMRRTLLEAMRGLIEREGDLMRARGRLALQVPALRARAWDDMTETQDRLSGMMAARLGADHGSFELKVFAGAFTGALYQASMEWVRQGAGDDLLDYTERALDLFEDLPRYMAMRTAERPQA